MNPSVRHQGQLALSILGLLLIGCGADGPATGVDEGEAESEGTLGQGLVRSGASWEYVGPSDFAGGHSFFGVGARVGRMSGVGWGAAAGTLWAASPTGGLVVSRDSGATWAGAVGGENFPTSNLSRIALQGNTVFVGTGNFDSLDSEVARREFAHNNGSSQLSAGLLRSLDGGQTWQNVGNGAGEFGNSPVSGIAIDPADGQTVIVTTGRGDPGILTFDNPTPSDGIWRSANNGDTWEKVSPEGWRFTDVKIGAFTSNRAQGGRMYYASAVRIDDHAGADLQEAGLFRSFNRGRTWENVASSAASVPPTSLPVPAITERSRVMGAAVAPSALSPNVVYFVEGQVSSDNVSQSSLTPIGAIYRSNDAGDTWTNITGNFPHRPAISSTQTNWDGPANMMRAVCGSVGGDDLLWIGRLTPSVCRGCDGKWTEVTDIHIDQRELAVNPADPSEVLIANDGGIYRARYAQSAGQAPQVLTQSLNRYLPTAQVWAFAFHPTDLTQGVVAMHDNAVALAAGNLADWGVHGGHSGDGFSAGINQSRPNEVLVAAQQYQSMSASTSSTGSSIWTEVNMPGFVTGSPPDGGARPGRGPLVFDPRRDHRALLGTDGIWGVELNASSTPTVVRGLLEDPSGWVQVIAPNPGDDRIYFGSTSGELWSSGHEAEPFMRVDVSGMYAGGADRTVANIRAISANPGNTRDILVGLRGDPKLSQAPSARITLWQTSDALATVPAWRSIDINHPRYPARFSINDIARDPTNPEQVWYVATEFGVWTTSDAGATWQDLNASRGLPLVRVQALQVVPRLGFLYAATFGRGVYRLALSGAQLPDLPDLVTTRVSTNRAVAYEGEGVTFGADINNRGAGSTPPSGPLAVEHRAAFRTDSITVATSSAPVNSLVDPGTSMAPDSSLSLPSSTVALSTVGGPFTLRAVVDDLGRIAESDEQNNALLAATMMSVHPARLTVRFSGLCMDVAGGSSADGAQIQQWACSGQSAQWFVPRLITPGVYELVNPGSGKCVDINGASTANGAKVQLWTCNGGNAQRFRFQDRGSGLYRVQNVNSNRCLSVSGPSTANGAKIEQWDCLDVDQELFAVSHLDSVARHSSLCLELTGGSTSDGTELQQGPCASSSGAQWFVPRFVGPGVYELAHPPSGKCVDVSGSSTANGAKIQLWSCSGTNAQRFRLEDKGGGYYRVKNVNSGRCLDVTGASMSAGAKVVQWDCGQGAHQQLRLPLTQVVGRQSNRCLSSPVATDGTQLELGDCVGSGLQWLTPRLVSPGTYELVGAATGKCVGINGASTANGARVQLGTCNGSNAQRFSLESRGGGFFRVKNVNSGRCLDVTSASTANGAKLQQWVCGEGQNQQFRVPLL